MTSHKNKYLLVCASVNCVYRITMIELREITHPKGSHCIAGVMKGERFFSALKEPK